MQRFLLRLGAGLAALALDARAARAVDIVGLRLEVVPARGLRFVSSDARIVLPASPSTDGAALTVVLGPRAPVASALPPGPGWSRTGAAERYANPAAPAGPSPCRAAVIRRGHLLKVACRDASGLTLPAPGDVDVAFTSGALRLETCFPSARLVRNTAAALVATRGIAGPCRAPRRPNMVVIELDDSRWDTVGYMPTVEQRLVNQGVSFGNSFVTTPLCAPSRASLLTGRYAHHTGILYNEPPDGGAESFDPSSTLATWLHDAGYRTGLFGKYLNGYASLAPAVPPGWDEWHAYFADTEGPEAGPSYFDYMLAEDGRLVAYGNGAQAYLTDVLARKLLRFVGHRAHSRHPFFALFTPLAPHVPATPAPRDASRLVGLPPWRPPSYDEADLSDKTTWWQQLPEVFPPSQAASRDAVRQEQLETLLAVDDAVRALLDTLDRLGIADDTLVLLTSDNGMLWGEHWWWGKECGYEESIRVPLVVRYPHGIDAPRVDPRMVLDIDVAPTLAALGRARVPAIVDGRSLVPLLRSASAAPDWRTDFLIEEWGRLFTSVPTWAGVRAEQWTYLDSGGEEELYDLVADPYEMQSRAADPAAADVLDSMRARLMTLEAE